MLLLEGSLAVPNGCNDSEFFIIIIINTRDKFHSLPYSDFLIDPCLLYSGQGTINWVSNFFFLLSCR